MSNLLFKYLFSTADYDDDDGYTLNDTSDNDDDATLFKVTNSSWLSLLVVLSRFFVLTSKTF